MSIRPSSLRAFLSTSRQALQNAIRSQSKVILVVGNESADLDSIASSILYAYLQTSAPLDRSNAATTTSQPPRVPYIPICNIPREDVGIRPELLALLSHAHLEPSYLLTVSDLPTSRIAAQGLIESLVLVDHNNPAGPLGALLTRELAAQRVGGCIDHHVDERVVPPRAYPRRIVTPCGSCASLVMLHWQSVWDALTAAASESRIAGGQDDAYTGVDDGAARRAWDVSIAKLALGPVLIDTRNLEDKDKVTDWDVQAAALLEARVGAKEPRWDRTAFWREIRDAKQDLSKLSVAEVLRKDYKEYESPGGVRLGIGSAVGSIAWLKGKSEATLLEDMQDFKQQRGLDSLALGTHFEDSGARGGFRRELALLGPLVTRVDAADDVRDQLGLVPSEEHGERASAAGGGDGRAAFVVWEQTRVEKSRKQTAPLLRALLD